MWCVFQVPNFLRHTSVRMRRASRGGRSLTHLIYIQQTSSIYTKLPWNNTQNPKSICYTSSSRAGVSGQCALTQFSFCFITSLQVDIIPLIHLDLCVDGRALIGRLMAGVRMSFLCLTFDWSAGNTWNIFRPHHVIQGLWKKSLWPINEYYTLVSKAQ